MKKRIKKPSQILAVADIAPVDQYLSTGCTLLDLAIADRIPGGFGVGRISQIYGPSSSAKSVLLAEPLGAAQRLGGTAVLVDSESTYDFTRGEELFGLNYNDFKYISPADSEDELTIEYLFDVIVPKVLKIEQKPIALGVDSLSAMPSDTEMDEGISDKSYGMSRAKGLSKAFRKYIWQLSKSNMSMIFIDQTRVNVGASFGKQHTVSGGKALGFYASTIVMVKKMGNIVNKHKKVIGVEIGFDIEKNKIAPPHRKGSFRLLFDYGIDDVGSNLVWLKKETGTSTYRCPDGKMHKSLNQAIDYVEDNDMEEDLRHDVLSLWQDLYAKVERKRKVR